MKSTDRGLAHVISATRYSLQGLRCAWRQEEAFRLETIVVALGLPLALWLARDTVDFLLLTMPLLLLILAELGNSAIEALVDRMGSDYHELSGRAKDFGSAMVFMAILMVNLSWGSMLLRMFVYQT